MGKVNLLRTALYSYNRIYLLICIANLGRVKDGSQAGQLPGKGIAKPRIEYEECMKTGFEKQKIKISLTMNSAFFLIVH
ncbi:hypothetical protein CJ305_06590 [Leeuwenhoekiella nanhaiensis]|uniref:Uncharacterized protein n=1 Tax=Leeuwenhoekiella nanhaiensis TaxID=1655491 RepID=A0A2G1VV11_9FLAO|nr:hypothetical protein CJ305_06590 [Leeuwenhoekiella nanhaiensis]